MISIIRYGMGNVGSILNMYRKLGIAAHCAETPGQVLGATHLILPGIGAFEACAGALGASGLRGPIVEAAKRGTPLLGICVGMQLLGDASDEGPGFGLGLIPGTTRLIVTPDRQFKVPHMGWNAVQWRTGHAVVGDLAASARFYFVHSYHIKCANPGDVLGTTNHGIEIVAAVAKNNIVGVQFHPEKSHRFGLELLRNFAKL